MLVNKKCRFCGKNFKAHTTKTRYCSHSCNSKHYKEKERGSNLRQLSSQVRERSYESVLEEIKLKECLSLEDCSLLLNVSRSTIKRIVNDGDLLSFNVRSRVIVMREDLNHYCISQFKKATVKSKEAQPRISNKAKHFNIENYYYMGEIPKYYNLSIKSAERYIKTNGIEKIKKGRFVYVLKSEIKKVFGAPIKTINND